jgi:SAM-dependent methyltransferase
MTIQPANHLLHDDLHAAVIDAGLRSHEGVFPDPELVEFLERVRLPVSSRVLDTGCGCGRNTVHLSRLGYVAVGIDCSPSAIVLSRRLAAEEGVGARFAVVDATENSDDYRNGFDLVIDLRCSHLITDPPLRRRFFENTHRWLADGGRYIGMQIGFVDQATAEERTAPESEQPHWELDLDTPEGPRRYKLRNDRIAPLWREGYADELRQAGFIDVDVEYSCDPGRRPCPYRLLVEARKAGCTGSPASFLLR